MVTHNTKGRYKGVDNGMTSTRRPVRAAQAAAAVGLLLAGLAIGAAPARAATGQQNWGAASQFVGQINSERASHGRARLTLSSKLSSVAASWASSMARSNRLGHNPNLAGSVSGWKVLGENVGVGPSVSSLESAFYNSSDHRANMIDSAFTLVGVAVVDVGDKLWVVEDFEQPTHSAVAGSAGSTAHVAPAGRPTRPGGTALSALQRARLHQLARLFAARHNLVLPGLTAHTARQRTSAPG